MFLPRILEELIVFRFESKSVRWRSFAGGGHSDEVSDYTPGQDHYGKGDDGGRAVKCLEKSRESVALQFRECQEKKYRQEHHQQSVGVKCFLQVAVKQGVNGALGTASRTFPSRQHI